MIYPILHYVRLSKIAVSNKPDVPSYTKEEHLPGSMMNAKSLPVEYWLEGRLKQVLEVGKPIQIRRYVRNGVYILGDFDSTPVTSIDQYRITTRNSVYEIKYIEMKDNPPELPTLEFPKVQCAKCEDVVKESDFFGRVDNEGHVICAKCWEPISIKWTRRHAEKENMMPEFYALFRPAPSP